MNARWTHVSIGNPPVLLERRGFNVDEFEAMGPLTMIAECAELIYGCVTDHTGDGRPHCWTYEQYIALAEAGILGVDERIELIEGEIVRRSRQAGPWDALLVVEVAESSLAIDQLVKGPRYARAVIPEFWIVDLNAPSVIVHRSPIGGEYTDVRTFGPGESWESSALGGRTVSVDEMLELPLPAR